MLMPVMGTQEGRIFWGMWKCILDVFTCWLRSSISLYFLHCSCIFDSWASNAATAWSIRSCVFSQKPAVIECSTLSWWSLWQILLYCPWTSSSWILYLHSSWRTFCLSLKMQNMWSETRSSHHQDCDVQQSVWLFPSSDPFLGGFKNMLRFETKNRS